MMRQIYIHILLILSLALSACSDTQEVFDGDAVFAVREGPVKAVAITVKSVKNGDPDKALMRRQGYEMAKRRLFQMHMARALSYGMQSEFLGEKAFKNDDRFASDLTIWSLGLIQAAENSERKLRKHPKSWALLEAFCDGVNQYIDELPRHDPDLLLRMRKLAKSDSYLPPRWKPVHSLAIATQMAFLLSNGIFEKIALGLMGYAALELLPLNPNLLDIRPIEAESIIPPKTDPTPDRDTAWEAPKDLKPMKLQPFVLGFGCQHGDAVAMLGGNCGSGFDFAGSNNWAVSKHFAGGKETLVSNDPHLSLGLPSSWMQVALDSKKAGGTFHIRGVAVVGLPGVLIGHNRDLAWAFTNNGADVDDVYAEDIQKVNEKWVARHAGLKKKLPVRIEKRSFQVRVDGELQTRTEELRWVPWHGPILTDHIPQFEPVQKVVSGLHFSYRWTGHEGDTNMHAVFQLNRARNLDEVRASLRHMSVGIQNVVSADKKGNLDYFAHGSVPIRKYASSMVPPYFPNFGNGSYEWSGYMPESELPQMRNPKEGYIISANNDPFGRNQRKNFGNFKKYNGFAYAPGSRYRQIRELLESKRKEGVLGAQDMLAIQYDHHDRLACRFLDPLQASLKAGKLNLTESEEAFVSKLIQWKGKTQCEAKESRLEPVRFQLWLSHLLKGYYQWLEGKVDKRLSVLTKEKRRELFMSFVGSRYSVQTVYHKVQDGLKSDREEKRKAIHTLLENAVKDSVLEMEERGLEETKWGQVHELEFVNAFEGLLPSLPFPPIPRDGTFSTVDVAGYNPIPELLGKNGKVLRLPNHWGPNFRMNIVLKEGEPIVAYNIMPGGDTTNFSKPVAVRELFRWGGQAGRLHKMVDFAE